MATSRVSATNRSPSLPHKKLTARIGAERAVMRLHDRQRSEEHLARRPTTFGAAGANRRRASPGRASPDRADRDRTGHGRAGQRGQRTRPGTPGRNHVIHHENWCLRQRLTGHARSCLSAWRSKRSRQPPAPPTRSQLERGPGQPASTPLAGLGPVAPSHQQLLVATAQRLGHPGGQELSLVVTSLATVTAISRDPRHGRRFRDHTEAYQALAEDPPERAEQVSSAAILRREDHGPGRPFVVPQGRHVGRQPGQRRPTRWTNESIGRPAPRAQLGE